MYIKTRLLAYQNMKRYSHTCLRAPHVENTAFKKLLHR